MNELDAVSKKAEVVFEQFIEVWESSSLLSKLMLITDASAIIDLNYFDGFKTISVERYYCIYNERKLIFGFKPVNTNMLLKVGEI